MAVALNLQDDSPPPPSSIEEHDLGLSSVVSKSDLKQEHDGNNDHEFPKAVEKTEAEASVASLMAFVDKMVNKKQLLITFISFICGAYAVHIGFFRDTSIYGYESRHQSAHSIKSALFIYGLVQLLLSVIFFITYAAATTTVGQSKWGWQIIGSVVGCIIYLLVAFIVLVVGILGFYRVMTLYGHVEYVDRQSVDYVDEFLYKSSLFTFLYHICFVLLKCCWWCR